MRQWIEQTRRTEITARETSLSRRDVARSIVEAKSLSRLARAFFRFTLGPRDRPVKSQRRAGGEGTTNRPASLPSFDLFEENGDALTDRKASAVMYDGVGMV